MWDTITFIGPRLAIASMIRMRRRRPSSVQWSLIWPGSSRGRSSVRMSSQASASRIAAPTMYSWCFSLSTQLDSSRKDFRSPAPGVVVTAPRYWELPTSTALSEQLLHTFGCASTTSPVGPVKTMTWGTTREAHVSNFGFIRAQWPELFDLCQRAESYALSDPTAAALTARIAVEKIVSYLFVDVFGLPEGYRSDLSARMNDSSFKNRTGRINNQLNLIRRRGNDAAHGNRRLTPREGVAALRDLFDVTVWTVKHCSTFPEAAPLGAAVDVAIAKRRAPLGPAELKQLADRFARQQEDAQRTIAERDAMLAEQEAELERLREQIAAAQAADTAADPHDYREDEARIELIDHLLHDAGWALDSPEDREYPVDELPIIPGTNSAGTGRVDYVLWGRDGLPLGVVEAKRTSVDPSVGGPQAKLYADAL